jgi:hypothetical protein
VSDMAGNAARVAVERSGRLPRYKADQLFTSANRVQYDRQQVVGRRGDRKRITPLFSSPPLFCSA